MLSALQLIANISLQGLLEYKIKDVSTRQLEGPMNIGKYKNKLSYGKYKENSCISSVEFTSTREFMEKEV